MISLILPSSVMYLVVLGIITPLFSVPSYYWCGTFSMDNALAFRKCERDQTVLHKCRSTIMRRTLVFRMNLRRMPHHARQRLQNLLYRYDVNYGLWHHYSESFACIE
jgi:hypothetical protein